MFIIGKASQKEIETMEEQGWTVEVMDETHFNKSLDPDYFPQNDPEVNENGEREGNDKLVAVFVDNDISKQLTKWYNKNVAHEEMDKRQELEKLRRQKADELFENASRQELCIPEESDVGDSDGWEISGEIWCKPFYYYDISGGADDSLKGTFIVTFVVNSDKVYDCHANT